SDNGPQQQGDSGPGDADKHMPGIGCQAKGQQHLHITRTHLSYHIAGRTHQQRGGNSESDSDGRSTGQTGAGGQQPDSRNGSQSKSEVVGDGSVPCVPDGTQASPTQQSNRYQTGLQHDQRSIEGWPSITMAPDCA